VTSPVWKIHRNGLFWLLVAFAAVIVLHADHLPSWILLAASVATIWRIQLYRSAWRPPSRLIKTGLLGLCLAGLVVEYGSPIGLEPMVALLVSAYLLKLLEMHHRRDAYLVVFLAFFITALDALFDQSIGNTLYIIGCLSLVLAALLGLHGSDAGNRHLRPLGQAMAIMVQALPLMLLLFIFMPRLGALWSVPMQQQSAKTGITDTMSPGDFSRLGRSGELAFRVSFEEAIPAQQNLYWRGLVLAEFDGRTWSRSPLSRFQDSGLVQWYSEPPKSWDQLIERKGEPLAFSVVIEPTQQRWLYALDTPKPDSEGVGLTRDYRLISAYPLRSKKQYRVNSWPEHRLEPQGLPPQHRTVYLQLPEEFNPRTRELASRWRKMVSDDLELVSRVLTLYNSEFVYTLQPPLLGKHSVDEFLFDSQRGFCEHFAGSFVFFMRAAGIPARVVAGYQGGERHPDDYLVVRQYDAHAWAEIWLEDRGWVRVDPTAAVAPQRIEQDLQSVLGDETDFLADSPVSLVRFRHIGWLNQLRLQIESLNYNWALWVLGYDQIQTAFLRNLLGDNSPWRIALALTGVGGGLLLLLGLWMLLPRRRERPRDLLDREFLRLCQKLEKAGFPRQVGEGPRDYAQRVAESRPELGRELVEVTRMYETMRYAGETPDARTLARIILSLRINRSG
tara:strand:- start:992 stop:3010 length:2019 start_codon:yes stop_codon:yes gene_type:complete